MLSASTSTAYLFWFIVDEGTRQRAQPLWTLLFLSINSDYPPNLFSNR